jgi:citrate synthase
VIETQVTEIDGSSLRFRGLDAVALATTHGFEDVAVLLWTGSLPGQPESGWRATPTALAAGRAAQAALPPGTLPLERLQVIVPALAATDPFRLHLDPPAVVAAGKSMIAGMVGALPWANPGPLSSRASAGSPAPDPAGPGSPAMGFPAMGFPATGFPATVGSDSQGTAPADSDSAGSLIAGSDATGAAAASDSTGAAAAGSVGGDQAAGGAAGGAAAVPGSAAAGSIAATLAAKLRPGQVPAGLPAVLNSAMVLVADHELAASTLAARVAASMRADPYAVVATALGPMCGALHGGAALGAEIMLAAADSPSDAPRVVGEVLRRGERLPGFGHFVYKGGDPRANLLLQLVAAYAPGSPELAVAQAVTDEVRRRALPEPNIEFGLAVLARVAGMVRGAGEAIFATGRSAGWLAHAMEEYERRVPIRPRAVYTGL